MRIGEVLGFAAGALVAPIAAAAALLRRGRALHEHGVMYRAEIVPEAKEGPALAVAQRLAGPALVHFTSALRRLESEDRPDVLGLSIRFRSSLTATALPAPGDQDLLFSTVRRAWELVPAALTTNVHSFLWDDYYALALFESAELGLVKWRVTTPRIPGSAMSRVGGLESAVKQGQAILHLQARDARGGATYQPVASVHLVERVSVDEKALRFSPFRTGRGIVPRGFINALRILPYAASQLARPRHE